MAGIVVLGIQQAIWVGNYESFVWWLLLPFFSPRIVGECAFQIGRVVGWFKRLKPQHLKSTRACELGRIAGEKFVNDVETLMQVLRLGRFVRAFRLRGRGSIGLTKVRPIL